LVNERFGRFIKAVNTALLVSTGDCKKLKASLACDGWTAIDVSDGGLAVTRARHEHLDAIIILSTGSEMDLTETALNLRDLQPSAEIILLSGPESGTRTAAELLRIERALPRTRILSADELSRHLATFDCQASASDKLPADNEARIGALHKKRRPR
jgi:hypothetical protein